MRRRKSASAAEKGLDGKGPTGLTGCRSPRPRAGASCCSCDHGCCRRTGTRGHCGSGCAPVTSAGHSSPWSHPSTALSPSLHHLLLHARCLLKGLRSTASLCVSDPAAALAGNTPGTEPKPSSSGNCMLPKARSSGFWHCAPSPFRVPTSHPQCPATRSSDRPQGQCSAGPRGCPW